MTHCKQALVLLLGGCLACYTAPPVSLYQNTPLTANDYPVVLESWTRSAKIYRDLDNKLFITATFHAPALRRAFALAFPDIYGHGGNITQRELVDLSGNVEQYYTFFLSVHTPELRWNDLAKNDSIWHLTLSGSKDVTVQAAEIVPIKVDANLRAVYPYISRFDKIYLARFPLMDASRRMVVDATTSQLDLRIASALGSADLLWKLTDL